MRKFVQSFVLAPQSAKKYYVHIDIFRYQDVYPLGADSDAQPQEQYHEGIYCHSKAETLNLHSTTSRILQLQYGAVCRRYSLFRLLKVLLMFLHVLT